jgi:hypothetical protein
LSREAETLLHQHALQRALSQLQIDLCRWLALVKSHLDLELSYRLLARQLRSVDEEWLTVQPTSKEVRFRISDSDFGFGFRRVFVKLALHFGFLFFGS